MQSIDHLPDGTYRVLSSGNVKRERLEHGIAVAMYPITAPDRQLYEGVEFGIWTDPETGERFVDRVAVLDDEHEDLAVRIAQTCDQRAVYAAARQEVMRV